MQSFADGEAVLCFASAPSIVRFQQSPTIKNRFAVARMPGSDVVFGFDEAPPATSGTNDVPYLGAAGAVLVVPKSSAHAAEAFKLAAYLSHPKTSRNIATDPNWGGGVFRIEHLAVGMGWGSFDLRLARRKNSSRFFAKPMSTTRSATRCCACEFRIRPAIAVSFCGDSRCLVLGKKAGRRDERRRRGLAGAGQQNDTRRTLGDLSA